MFDFRIFRMGAEVSLIGGPRFVAAPDAQSGLTQIVPGAPIVRLEFDRRNCPGSRPEALCVSCEAERIYQDFRFVGDGLDDVPALLFGSGDE